MRVNEVFYSIQGEGVLAGIPMVFIRLQGCNLSPHCSYCDTVYAQNEGGEELHVGEVGGRVRSFLQLRGSWVCITGGEPLLQSDALLGLVGELRRSGYRTEIETNGSYPPPSWFSLVDSWVADVKCPSSGVCGVSKVAQWFGMRKEDQVKFVVASVEDLEFVKRTMVGRWCIPQVLVSPVASLLVDKEHGKIEEYWNKDWLQEVAEFCKDYGLRYSLQVHKIVWGNKRGV